MRAGVAPGALPAGLEADRAVAWFAGQQHGVVSTAQLAAAGLTPEAIRHRLARGRLHRQHPSVVAVTPVLSSDGLRLAALLACQPAAMLSHHSAAASWGLDVREEERHVTVIGRDVRPAGVTVHRSRTFDPRDLRWLGGLPLTAPARTVLDVAPTTTPVGLERLLADAWSAGLVTEDDLRHALERNLYRAGAAIVRAALDDGAPRTRSEAERVLQALVRRAALPRPRTNVRIAGFEVDSYWPDSRLVVEVDSWRFHGSRRSFEADRRRRWRLQASGVRVEHVTWRQLTQRPEETVALLAVAIAQGVGAATR